MQRLPRERELMRINGALERPAGVQDDDKAEQYRQALEHLAPLERHPPLRLPSLLTRWDDLLRLQAVTCGSVDPALGCCAMGWRPLALSHPL